MSAQLGRPGVTVLKEPRTAPACVLLPLPFLCLHPWSSAVPPEPALLVLDSFSSVRWAPSVADTMLDTQDGKDPNSRPWGLSAVTSVQPCSPVWLYDPMDRSTPGIPVYHQLQELSQTHDPSAGDAIQPSHPLLSSSPPAFNLPQHQCIFQWVGFSHQVAKSIGASASASVLPVNIQDRFPLTRQTVVGKVISVLFNKLSMLVIAFLPRSKHLLRCCSHHLQWFWSPRK